jgi:hypothetical protein
MEAVRLIVERRRRENLPNIRLKTRIGLPTTGNGKRRLREQNGSIRWCFGDECDRRSIRGGGVEPGYLAVEGHA